MFRGRHITTKSLRTEGEARDRISWSLPTTHTKSEIRIRTKSEIRTRRASIRVLSNSSFVSITLTERNPAVRGRRSCPHTKIYEIRIFELLVARRTYEERNPNETERTKPNEIRIRIRNFSFSSYCYGGDHRVSFVASRSGLADLEDTYVLRL